MDFIDNLENLSFNSMEGLESRNNENAKPIDNCSSLVSEIKNLFSIQKEWAEREKAITQLLNRVDLSTSEINKFTFWDSEKPYTRNLIASDGENYSILLLCWNPGKESKIHNHPCDGCFVKTLRGCIRETRYVTIQETNEIRQTGVRFYCENQVSFMNDSLGLHKIGNPNRDTGSVSLHLYTPPFASCKVWNAEGKDRLQIAEISPMGFFSVYGLRTPHLEGRPGIHARVMEELMLVLGDKFGYAIEAEVTRLPSPAPLSPWSRSVKA